MDIDILNKEEKLSDNEIVTIRSHVEQGLDLISGSGHISHHVYTMIESHHERHNGNGYPYGLMDGDIPVSGRIGGIVDTYDAMVNERPFSKKPYSPHQAIYMLYKSRNTLFDSMLVEQFIQTVGVYPSGSLVELETGEVGMVISANKKARLRPQIMLIMDTNKKMMKKYQPVNLIEREELAIKKALAHSAYGIKMNEVFLSNICEFFQ